jgi:4-hydroxy-tetrahydrodipicolinate synthase
MFEGSIVALVTPFRNGKLDEKTLKELVEFHVSNGTHGIVPCGTTGESATLSHREHGRVVEIVARQAKGRILVLAGAGSNSTKETLALCRHARDVKADGALAIVPYYNKPTPAGMFEHFSTVASRVSLPIVIYNIPSRTGVNMPPATLIHLAKRHRNIVGVKESSGNMDQITEIILGVPPGFSVLSGDDSLTLPILSLGGRGVISVLANVAPRDVAQMCRAWQEGNITGARRIHYRMYPLTKALFVETNPGPVKAALAMMGICREEFRLPLVKMSSENRQKLRAVLAEFGLVRRVS